MKEQDLRSAGPRPEGVSGLLIDEIELKRILRTAKGYVADVRDGARRPYLLKAGDQLFDGDVISIDSKEVVFKQVIADAGASKPYREVVKSLPGA